VGTSQSSEGPGANVSLVPPWADGATEPPDQGELEVIPAMGSDPQASQSPLEDGNGASTAPDRRFVSTRRSLGSFAKSGDVASLRRGVAHYVRAGYGGAGTMSRRLAAVSTTAGSLGRALDPDSVDSGLNRALLSGKSADEIIDAVVEASRPHDGTLDAEASREAIRNALSDLLSRDGDADLLNLNDNQREFVIEHFAAHEVYRRFALDVGKHLVAKAPNATIGLARLKQARNYIGQTIAESFRRLREAGQSMTTGNVRATVANALADSLAVFEGYLT
jgi:hypothetical protein